MANNWESFWQAYRAIEPRGEDDLFFQVGKTVQSKPIDPAVFRDMVARIVDQLALQASDRLFEMCCGNGLVTRELAPQVAHVTAVDFASHLIDAARRFKAAGNIEYRAGDVFQALSALEVPAPDKYLMNDSLGYFDPSGLRHLLDLVRRRGNPRVRLLFTGIPDHARKWNFYRSPEQQARHRSLEASTPDFNDGMGRWWQASEIEVVAAEAGFLARVEAQPQEMSNYRMDALLWSGAD